LWSAIGTYHNIVKEQLATTRHEQLEDALMHFNQQKLNNLGSRLVDKLWVSLSGYNHAICALYDFIQEADEGWTLEYIGWLVDQEHDGKAIFTKRSESPVMLKNTKRVRREAPRAKSDEELDLDVLKGQIREFAVDRYRMIDLKRSMKYYLYRQKVHRWSKKRSIDGGLYCHSHT
jgi:hypothetical protein